MPQNNQQPNQEGIFQIPRDFSGKAAPAQITELQVGQEQPVEDNNPIYDTGGVSWGTLSLVTLVIIILGIALVRYMNQQSWLEFFTRANARNMQHIQNDRDLVKLVKTVVALRTKLQEEK